LAVRTQQMSTPVGYPTLSPWFYRLLVLVTTWWIAGGYTDMWAHAHIAELETFFTPWHGVFFSGFFATAALFVGTAWSNHRKGYPWERSLPRVYVVALCGILGFQVGGMADMIWHILFGIEKNLAIIISPPHVIIAVSAMTVTMSICRIMWSRDGRPEGTPTYILVMLLAYVCLAFNYMLDYFNPFAFPYMMRSFAESKLYYPQIGEVRVNELLSEILGFANVMLFTAFFMGMLLMSIRYWRPPFGAFTVVFFLNTLAITLAYGRHYWFILAGTLAGLVADVVYKSVVPRFPAAHLGVRLFAFIVPVVLFSGYALTIVLTDDTLWSKEMWGGTILLSGLVGVLQSYLMAPPLIAPPEHR
jgi:hypothetical protein